MNIKNYKSFVTESPDEISLTTEQIDFLNNYVIGKWHMNDDEAVDIDDVFDCSNKGISDFKGIVFGKVDGDFDCSHNNLSSLEGAPKEVGVDFDCSNNNLASLEGAPKEVGRGFYFNHNEGVYSETLKSIFTKMLKSKLEYSDALKSLWKEIPIDDKILLYSSDSDWFDSEEAAKLAKLKKYNSIKQMI